jgi:hypothetical protein
MQDAFIIQDDFDKEFIHLIIEIEKHSKSQSKQQLLIIDKWCQKFCEITTNLQWKKNRNLHAIYLLDMILNTRIEEPYNKYPKDESLPILSKSNIKSVLSDKIREVDFSQHKIIFERCKMEDGKDYFIVKNEEEVKKIKNNQATRNKVKFNVSSMSSSNIVKSDINVQNYLSPKGHSCSRITKKGIIHLSSGINSSTIRSKSNSKEKKRNKIENENHNYKLNNLQVLLKKLEEENLEKANMIIKNESVISDLQNKLEITRKTLEIMVLNKGNKYGLNNNFVKR